MQFKNTLVQKEQTLTAFLVEKPSAVDPGSLKPVENQSAINWHEVSVCPPNRQPVLGTGPAQKPLLNYFSLTFEHV